MFAQVIVDVPAKGTNRPFDYRVPAHLQQWVGIGSRVGVPFGPRIVQGFVVGLRERTDADPGKLRDIAQVSDLQPPLTEELVELAEWMSRTYLCHQITALQAMIPAALKAKYERHVQWSAERERELCGDPALGLSGTQAVKRYMQEKAGVTLDALLERFPEHSGLIKHWLKAGLIGEEQVIKDRLAKKTALTVIPPERLDMLAEARSALPANARRQRQVLAFLQENPQPIRLAELMLKLEVGASTVKSLADKGWIELREVEVLRDPYAGVSFARTAPLELTGEQAQAFAKVRDAVAACRHEVFLLHGVTGSGKTEVYLQSIQQCLDQGKEAIVLVPEISLTPQMVERFKGRFGDEVAVLHSRLSHGERYDEWRKIIAKQVKVVIGARSAVFAPFTRIGLIIIDEEHESSYKQEESPKYHARDVAIERAKRHGAAVVLGSATPSLESYYEAADKGRFRLLKMDDRVQGRGLPPVRIVDMREELKNGNRSMFSRALHRAVEARLERREQAVILLNRRGYSTFVMCRTCGYTVTCPHCDIALTYHQSSSMVRCHYCGYAERQPRECPSCASPHIRYFGTGTQKVEEELGRLYPGIRVIRMDVDTTAEKGAHEKLLGQFRNKQADVLLGTQMVAKGLDFPDVTLVGVITADTVLNLPDFRSAERTFQLLTQVAGRAGRHEKPGEVIVQTYTPEHYAVVASSRHDYAGFVGTELEARRRGSYPPFCRLALITLSHERIPLLVRTAESLVKRLKEQRDRLGIPGFAQAGGNVQLAALDILGPVASPIPRIKDRYRFQCMIKYRGDAPAAELIARAVETFDDVCRQEKLTLGVDVDPQVLM